jgi:antitoxin (DNA-binding transcriptional repressor) of toxin-antitoxin stability system
VREIGVRALRMTLSQVLADVRAGEAFVVTQNGAAVARIEPLRPSLPPSLRSLIDAGRASWGGTAAELMEPATLVGEGPTVA